MQRTLPVPELADLLIRRVVPAIVPIEGGWLLTLSVLLIAATVWLVGRRAT